MEGWTKNRKLLTEEKSSHPMPVNKKTIRDTNFLSIIENGILPNENWIERDDTLDIENESGLHCIVIRNMKKYIVQDI